MTIEFVFWRCTVVEQYVILPVSCHNRIPFQNKKKPAPGPKHNPAITLFFVSVFLLSPTKKITNHDFCCLFPFFSSPDSQLVRGIFFSQRFFPNRHDLTFFKAAIKERPFFHPLFLFHWKCNCGFLWSSLYFYTVPPFLLQRSHVPSKTERINNIFFVNCNVILCTIFQL